MSKRAEVAKLEPTFITPTASWKRRVAAAAFIGGVGGAALVDYGLPYQHFRYYAAAVIVIGLGAGVFLDDAEDEHIPFRLLMAMVPASMPLLWTFHCLLFSGGGCGASGGEISSVDGVLRIAFLWTVLTIAVLIGSFAWPLLLWAVEELSGKKVSNTVSRMARLVTKISGLLGAVSLVAYKFFI